MKALAPIALAAALAACSDGYNQFAGAPPLAMVAPSVHTEMLDQAATGEARDAKYSTGADPAAPPAPAVTPLLAYAYDYGVEAPAARIRPLIAAHESACRQAGAAVCQLTGASVSEDGADRVSGRLTLRAEPAWLTRFREGLEADARRAGGRLTYANTQTDDLTRQIIDTEARLRAQTTLRDRLQAHLAGRPGDLEDLLKLEEALARVQGEIDSAQSNLAHMRQRVATSTLTIAYESAPSFASEGAWSPVRDAIGGFQGVMAGTIAALIVALAALIPLGAVAAALFFLIRLAWRRLRARLPGTKAAPPADRS